MKPQKLRDLYSRCCDAKGYPPNAGQLDEWREQLGHLEEADLSYAITEWFKRNAMFPMPNQLRELAAQRLRSRQASENDHELTEWNCGGCGALWSSLQRGYTPGSCRACGSLEVRNLVRGGRPA